MEKFIYSIMTDKNKGFASVCAKPVFLIMSWMYGLGTAIIRTLYAFKVLTVRKLSKPVICVGNITIGGAGKTPLVIELVRYIQAQGLRPAVLTRGYMLKNAQNAQSDEVLMMQEILKDVPIIVGKNRYAQAKAFLSKNECDVFIMDDGYQHCKLFRDINICVINASNPFGNGHILPRGILREQKCALGWADYVVLTKLDRKSQSVQPIISQILPFVSKNQIIESRHVLKIFTDLTNSQKNFPVDHVKGKEVCLLSSIGDSAFFEDSVKRLGCEVVHHFAFRDHYVYQSGDIDKISEYLQKNNINTVITTHKDAVKLKKILNSDFAAFEILVLHANIELQQEENALFEQIDSIFLGRNLQKINNSQETVQSSKDIKNSQEVNIAVICDAKTGHTNQSQAVARILKKILSEKHDTVSVQIIPVEFKGQRRYKIFACLGLFSFPFYQQGSLEFLKLFITDKSVDMLNNVKASFVISTGSSLAGINYLLTKKEKAKNIVILKPGLLRYKNFDVALLPEHDKPRSISKKPLFVFTHAAPNLIDKKYLDEKTKELLHHFSHLKNSLRMKIGLFIGGDAKTVYISEQQIRILVNQLKEILKEMKVELLITTSRRTPARVESILVKEFKKHPGCLLFVQPNKENVPEAVGGIMGLSDILIVSGDSVSMVSEAISSGKKTIVFSPEVRAGEVRKKNKYHLFIENLSQQGFIVSTDTKNIGQSIYNIVKNKIQTRQLVDNEIISDSLRRII